MIWFLLIATGWIYWGSRLIDNFSEELDKLDRWRGLLLQAVLTLGAGFFFIEEMLEILIDVIVGEEEE